MRILLISGSLPPMKCGVGDYTAHLAKALSRRVDSTVAVLTDVSATPIPSDFDFEVLPVSRGWRMADVVRIASAARRWRPDLVHIQYPTQGYGRRYLPWLLPSLFRVAGVPVVQTWHGYDSRRMSRRFIPNSVLTGGLIVVRPEYIDMMSPLYKWLNRRKHVKFIPNAATIPATKLAEQEKTSLRMRLSPGNSNLVAFFGFAYPDRGVELLFQIADPARHSIVLISDLSSNDAYQASILDYANREPWDGKVTITGYLPAEEVGRILAAADALVLPFRDGGGMWNTSIRAGATQGTFVLTTARERQGYDSGDNVYYARPDDVADMKSALQRFIGRRKNPTIESMNSIWDTIALDHASLYETVASSRVQKSRPGFLAQK
jgi:glycosyltransferase involved in cell wall biosynthesis